MKFFPQLSSVKQAALLVILLCSYLVGQSSPAFAQFVVSDPITESATTVTAVATSAELAGWVLEWPQLNGLLANLNSSLHVNMNGGAHATMGAAQATIDQIDRNSTLQGHAQLASDATVSATSPAGCTVYAGAYRTNAGSMTSGINSIYGQVNTQKGQGPNAGTFISVKATEASTRCGNGWTFEDSVNATLCNQQQN